MKLRKIEILGFKSFRAKTGIEIGDGITSVVGPNGCGKSNIVDAIRWAMGSQSPRDLRGRAMEDVIFNGSENHRPMGFAEVSLTFDNDPRTSLLPLEWREMDSVKVTRRLFRSGESEYEINGSRARLRDIQDVFAGTGVSARDAYSIIEQGRIGFIVASKPEERRVIIEEAAGITRYRNQRKLAEKRLEKTRDNLLRVSDVQKEVLRQLGSLERQAAKAAKAREIQSELRKTGLILHADALRTSRDAFVEAQRVLAAGDEQATNSQLELSRAETRLEEAKLLLLSLEAQLNEASENAFQARSRMDLLNANLQHREREQSGLIARQEEAAQKVGEDETKVEELKRELADFSSRNGDQDEAREALEEEIYTLEERQVVERQKINAARAKLDRAKEELSECERVLVRASTRSDSLRADLKGLKGREEDLLAQREEISERASDARTKVRSLNDDLVDLEEIFETQREDLERVEERLKIVKTELEQAKARTREVGSELRLCTSTLDSVRRVIASGAGLAEGAREVLKLAVRNDVPGVLGPLAQRFRLREGDEHRLSLTLGHFADAVVVDNRASARILLTLAKDAGVSISVVVLADPVEGKICDWADAIAPVPSLVAERIRSTVFLKEVDAASSGRAVYERFVIEEGTAFSYSAGEMAAEQLVRAHRELALLEAKHNELEEREVAAIDEESRLSREYAALEARRDLLAERFAISETERRKLRMRLEEAREFAQHAERLLRRASEELAEFERRRKELEDDLSRTREEAAVAAESRDELADRVREEQSIVNRLEASREEIDERLNHLRVRRARLEAEERALKETRARILRDIESTNERIAYWRKTLSNAEEERAALAFAVSREQEELARWTRKSNELDGLVLAARANHEQQLLQTREHEIALADTRRLVAGQMKSRESAALALERTRADLQRDEDLCRSKFGISPDEVLLEAGGIVATAEHAAQHRELQERLERLGAVNPHAEQEFNAAQERHAFLTAQVQDLESALKDLESAIRRMDRTCRELFEKTFHIVNEGFQRMFPRLFRGGRAHLELTNPDDLLATGIEIIAQPPGKRLQSIQLMSGGEKALTATALIFAIFELKPSPICILDEVDAPLDEANVGRFADMVREISARSQFLVITHNTRTMEAADTLYGVTMEEPGVSRLVGVQLRAQSSSVPTA